MQTILRLLALVTALGLGAASAESFAVDASLSEVRYRVTEQLAGVSFPNDAVGVTSAVSGTIDLTDTGQIGAGAQITVEVSGLTSDERRRDGFVRDNLLQARRHPVVTFSPTQVTGLSLPLGADAAEVTITGDLTVKGVTRQVTWQGTVRVEDGLIRLSAATTFTFADFELSKPRVALVLSVDDDITLEVDLVLREV